jgi:hypothetical protein
MSTGQQCCSLQRHGTVKTCLLLQVWKIVFRTGHENPPSIRKFALDGSNGISISPRE